VSAPAVLAWAMALVDRRGVASHQQRVGAGYGVGRYNFDPKLPVDIDAARRCVDMVGSG